MRRSDGKRFTGALCAVSASAVFALAAAAPASAAAGPSDKLVSDIRAYHARCGAGERRSKSKECLERHAALQQRQRKARVSDTEIKTRGLRWP